MPGYRLNGDETRWDVKRVYQRKRVDTLAWRALLTARRKRWIKGVEEVKKQSGEMPVRKVQRNTL